MSVWRGRVQGSGDGKGGVGIEGYILPSLLMREERDEEGEEGDWRREVGRRQGDSLKVYFL